jgi:hypothetical protein
VTTLDEVTAATPPPLTVPGARATIRAEAAASGRRVAVLDDDPTGSQTVHDVTIVTVTDTDAVVAGLSPPGCTCFVLTNSRSLPEPQAADLTRRLATTLHGLEREWDAPLSVVSRSDSTLRGHLLAEVGALHDARRRSTGRGWDGVLLGPRTSRPVG